MKHRLYPKNVAAILALLLLVSMLGNLYFYNSTKQMQIAKREDLLLVDDALSGRTLDVSIGNNSFEFNSSLATFKTTLSEAYTDMSMPVEVFVNGDPFSDDVTITLDSTELQRSGSTYTGEIHLNSLRKNNPIELVVSNETTKRTVDVFVLPENFPDANVAGDVDVDKGSFYYTNFYSPNLGNQETWQHNDDVADNFIVKYNHAGEVVFYKSSAQELVNFNKWTGSSGETGYYYFVEDDSSTSISPQPYRRGEYVVLDTQYREIDRVKPQYTEKYTPAEPLAEVHDFIVLDKGHYIVMDYYTMRNVDGDLEESPYLQEIQNGAVVWEWLGFDHEYFREAPPHPDATPDKSTIIDRVHTNSVYVDPTDGNILLSNRGLSSAVKIDKSTGEPIWVLGGKGNQFNLGDLGEFVHQHDFHRLPDGRFALYDNSSKGQSRGVIFRIDEVEKTVSDVLVLQESEKGGLFTGSMRHHNDLFYVGWGMARQHPSLFTVFDADGKALKDLVAATPTINTYRVYAHSS